MTGSDFTNFWKADFFRCQKSIYFRSDANKQAKEQLYNINLLKETLGDDVCNQLIFIHAYSGCDSTSRIFGIGKKSAFQKLVKSDRVMKSCASPERLPQLPLQQHSIAYVCITKLWYGWAWQMT